MIVLELEMDFVIGIIVVSVLLLLLDLIHVYAFRPLRMRNRPNDDTTRTERIDQKINFKHVSLAVFSQLPGEHSK